MKECDSILLWLKRQSRNRKGTPDVLLLLLLLLWTHAVRGACEGEENLCAQTKTLTLVPQSTVAENASLIDFRNELIPVFTKHGCNAGACHGAAIGRGGFKLSLYGGNPAADYDAIVRQTGGRRVNLSRPNESLIVRKPVEFIEHGGGTVFDEDSESARILVDWIKQGAQDKSTRRLKYLEVTPRRYVAKSVGEPVPLRAVAHFSNGAKEDVTRWTVFAAEDSSAVEIDSQSLSRATRRGRHIVVARYLSEVVPIELIVPLTDSKVDLVGEARSNFVDDEILESLAMLGLEPSPKATDAVFLRRIVLDLTGRLPSAERVRAFLGDNDPDKRAALVDELLHSQEFTEYWTLQLAKLLRIRPQQRDSQGAVAYHRWLAKQIRDDVSYKLLARNLIMAMGDSHEHGPANFYRTVAGPREQAEFVSEVFMGSRLRCANCHNHPLDRWTQDDYHGLAAIFAKIERGRVIREKPNGKTIHPRTLEPAIPRIPGEQYLGDAADARKQLAGWLTDQSNPYFATAIVNRLWKRMMGRGLVEPVDDFRATNPATHPALLEQLAEDFSANGYSLRHTLKVIATSSAYARSADATETNGGDDRFYSHAQWRPLEPEVLADSISDVLGVGDKYGDEPEGTRAVALVNPQTSSRTLDILGRCRRDESCEGSAVAVGGLAQKLHLFNGPLLNARISADGSRLNQLLGGGEKPFAIIDEFYMVALGRHPTNAERTHWKRELQSADNTPAYLEDFVWGLVTSREFTTNR